MGEGSVGEGRVGEGRVGEQGGGEGGGASPVSLELLRVVTEEETEA